MSLDKVYETAMRALEINQDNLSEELARQPSNYAYWGALFSRAVKKLSRQKVELESTETRLAREYRIAMAADDPRQRVTESMVRTFIVSTDEYKDQIQKVIYAQHEADLLDTARRAFQQRAQMLMELGRMRREEMYEETGLNIYRKEDRGKDTTATRKFQGLLNGKKRDEL